MKPYTCLSCLKDFSIDGNFPPVACPYCGKKKIQDGHHYEYESPDQYPTLKTETGHIIALIPATKKPMEAVEVELQTATGKKHKYIVDQPKKEVD